MTASKPKRASSTPRSVSTWSSRRCALASTATSRWRSSTSRWCCTATITSEASALATSASARSYQWGGRLTEEEITVQPATGDQGREQAGLEAEAADAAVARPARVEIAITKDDDVALGECGSEGKVRRGHLGGPVRDIGREQPDELKVTAVLAGGANAHRVEVEDGPDGIRDALEELADIEACAEHRREGRDRLQPLPPPSLAVQGDDVLYEGRDEVADLPQRRHVAVPVDVGRAVRHAERPDRLPAGVQRHAKDRSDSGGDEARALLRPAKSRIVPDVTGEDDVSPQKDRTERPLVGCVPARGIEIGRVASLVKQEIVGRVFREDGRGAVVVFEIRHQDPVVRDEPLGARGEVVEKEPRIERRLQGLAERRDAGEQIFQHCPFMGRTDRREARSAPGRGDSRNPAAPPWSAIPSTPFSQRQGEKDHEAGDPVLAPPAPCRPTGKIGGAEGARTPDPKTASLVLSQLSYSPTASPSLLSARSFVKIDRYLRRATRRPPAWRHSSAAS